MRFTALLFSLSLPLNALTIQIDYSLDTNDFFLSRGNPQGQVGATQAKAALEAAAARWSAILNETLPEVNVPDHPDSDVRLSFPDPSNFSGEISEIEYILIIPDEGDPFLAPVPINNPGATRTYEIFEIGSAASSATDSLVTPGLRPPANQYTNGISIPEDTFRIYVGGRPLQSDAFTGAFVGNNLESVANDRNSILNRGFNEGLSSLPTWGSSISFNSREDANNNPVILERKWHFDHTTAVPSDAKDFYSVALAEIGHALGIGLLFNDWTKWNDSAQFKGTFVKAAYLEEHGTQITGLELQQPAERYFKRDLYTSKIFAGGDPNYVDTVGPGVHQSLLFQARRYSEPGVPQSEFIPGIIHGRRYEITNIDVAAIKDLGWSAISPAPENEVTFVTLDRNKATGTVTLAFPSEVGASYTIQTSTNMDTWNNVSPALMSEGTSTDWRDGETGFFDPTQSSFLRRKKYYRVLKNP